MDLWCGFQWMNGERRGEEERRVSPLGFFVVDVSDQAWDEVEDAVQGC